MNRALPGLIAISIVMPAACGGSSSTPAAAPEVIAILIGQERCDVLRPSTCPAPPAEGDISIVFDRLLQGDKAVDVVNVDGAWRQVPIGLEAGTPQVPVVLQAGGTSLEGHYVVTYQAGGKVDPDSGEVIAGVGPALTLSSGQVDSFGDAVPLTLPPDTDVSLHLVPAMVVAETGGLEYSGPDFTYRTAPAAPASDAGSD